MTPIEFITKASSIAHMISFLISEIKPFLMFISEKNEKIMDKFYLSYFKAIHMYYFLCDKIIISKCIIILGVFQSDLFILVSIRRLMSFGISHFL